MRCFLGDLLDEIFPGSRNIICAAEHDIVFLDVDEMDIEKLTDDQIIELRRCGVHYDYEVESLAMFS